MISTSTKPANHSSFTFTIDGMTCGHCVQVVTRALAGVQRVAVRSVGVGSAAIRAPEGLTVSRAVAALEEAGYSARASEAPPTRAIWATKDTSCCGGMNQNAARSE